MSIDCGIAKKRNINNVIVILVDSVFSECIGTGRTEKSSTPFLDSLKENSIFLPNVFSFGPYTNAATKGLFCSEPTLEEYGYYFGINASLNNNYKVFKDSGYETFSFYYPYYLVSSNTENSIDHSVFTAGFVYSAIWRGQLEYYSVEKKKRNLELTEYTLLIKFIRMMFECWENYYNTLLREDESRLLLGRYLSIEKIKGANDLLKREKESFLDNQERYIDSLLEQGISHQLDRIDCIDRELFADKSFLKDIFARNKNALRKIQRINFMKNIKNNRLSFRYSVKALCNCIHYIDKKELRYYYNCYCSLMAPEKMTKDAFNGVWQEMPSARTQLLCGIELLKKYRSETPFYMQFHVLDPHERISYFSYDTNNSDLVSKEIHDALHLAERCGVKFKGSILYQLSLRYIDSCIKELFDYLKNSPFYSNTIVMVVSDHGSSYTYNPIRMSVVNNFHKENYILCNLYPPHCIMWGNVRRQI